MGFLYQEMYVLDLGELENLIIQSRQGLAYQIWRSASLIKHPLVTNFPENPKDACPELFPQQPSVQMSDWLYKRFMKRGGR